MLSSLLLSTLVCIDASIITGLVVVMGIAFILMRMDSLFIVGCLVFYLVAISA